MALKVVGAGFGRTGTLSLKSALERLGFGPCYHMFEVVERPEHIEMWHRLAYGGSIDWELLFKDFQSTVDWPASRYWRELADYYPEAKVLLSVRDPDAWYKSVTDTIYQGMKMRIPDHAPEPRKRQMAMARKIVMEDTFDGRFEDKAYAIGVFNRHNQAVREAIDPARLLVFDVKEGWAPLCRFLGVAQPDEPFPRLNDTATIQAMMKQMRESGRA
ncbi:MAG: sulfotransferase family protein [Candidatus Binataceae bacterium]